MSQDSDIIPERARRIAEIIEERDKIITETEAKIQYHINELENLKRDIREQERLKNEINDDNEAIVREIKQISSIKDGAERSFKVTLQALENQKIMNRALEKQIEQEDKDYNTLLQELEENYNSTETKLKERNPLYHELQLKKTECLKNKIACKMMERDIRKRKEINTAKIDMQKRLFYADCVKLAESYFMAQEEKKQEKLKQERTERLIKLHELQEQVKLKNKLGRSHHHQSGIKKQITGLNPTAKENLNIETPLCDEKTKEEESHFEELDKFFATSQTLDDSIKTFAEENSNAKIVILDQEIIPPLPPLPAVPVKRKRPVPDVYLRWKKLNSSFGAENLASSQQSQRSQLSQKSENSQKSQLLSQSEISQQISDRQSQVTNILKESTTQEHKGLLNNSFVEELNNMNESTMANHLDESIAFAQKNETTEVGSGTIKQVLSGFENCEKSSIETKKSVRFNLNVESNAAKESRSIFEGLSMFGGSTFSSFFNQPAVIDQVDTTADQDIDKAPNTSMLDMSLANASRYSVASDLYRSPEFDITDDVGNIEINPFGALPMTNLGFSFGSKSIFK